MSARVRAVAGAVALALCLPSAASAVSPAPLRPAPQLATVRVLSCVPEESRALFHARMRATPLTVRMAMRLTLLERLPGAALRVVRAPGLDRWRRSRPGVRAFGVRQAVRNLAAGAAYRIEVSYRWHGRRGGVLRRARRRSRLCREPAPLPNLRVRVIGAEPYAPGLLSYVVGVGNLGAAPASAVSVRLAVDGAPLDPLTVAWLPPGAWRRLEFRGPSCEAAVEAAADPDGAVAESDEGDNAHALACSELLP